MSPLKQKEKLKMALNISIKDICIMEEKNRFKCVFKHCCLLFGILIIVLL